ncbi:hypothetical protein O6H91_05G058300 [Diphasiastrum complanatum]|uniref:Uncharacterized protein n=1 Tax=Diphasiastrum complanatum TaxID=34168 RepID=A0ACC2DNQ1_DIPCM|nr:hypothetical protein O6H91_05G058300 [Diphasiastrum complanatum]
MNASFTITMPSVRVFFVLKTFASPYTFGSLSKCNYWTLIFHIIAALSAATFERISNSISLKELGKLLLFIYIFKLSVDWLIILWHQHGSSHINRNIHMAMKISV